MGRFRHRAVVDIDAALDEVGPLLDWWLKSRSVPGVPLFSGGLLDAWPKVAVEALSVCESEWLHVQAALAAERPKKAGR